MPDNPGLWLARFQPERMILAGAPLAARLQYLHEVPASAFPQPSQSARERASYSASCIRNRRAASSARASSISRITL